jgi:dipeptidyl aminopeptidase/acylaminoacyl peptidase
VVSIAERAADAPLIPRARLYGDPTRAQGRISPDGRWLSWLAPRDGVRNIWVAPASDPVRVRALTAETVRPIGNHFWAPDSSMVLFFNDRGGDEDYLLYGVNLATGAERTFTPYKKTRAMVVATSRRVKDRILVGLNNRDPRWHDVYSLDLASGALALVFENDGYAGFWADKSLTLRLASRSREDGGSDFFRVSNRIAEAEPVASVSLEDAMSTAPVGFTTDGKTLYWTDSRGRDTAALVAQEFASGSSTVLASDPRADIGGILTDPETGVVEAYAVTYLRTEWTGLDPRAGADLAYLKAELKGDIHVVSRTDADDAWIVVVDPVNAPSSTYRYDRVAKSLTRLFDSYPELAGATLAAMVPHEIHARDGLTLVSYLTLPPGSDPEGKGRPDRPLPMVLLVHGGPWGRDACGYNPDHQWLANRGYAVLSVNFRGSTGFGKTFLSAGDREWAAKMHDDLIDAVDWAVNAGIAAADKVAIMGISYGGYAALVGVTFTPETFACGISIVGPSNLNTLLETIPPYWASMRHMFRKRIGDPATEEGRQLLRDRSPLTRVDAITKPLLIGQGANDPRVKQAESEQIVGAMAGKAIPVTYILFPDEGHGFARPENRIAFIAAAEQFLAACLGGRTEPIGDAMKASSAIVRHGAEFTPGLAEAMSR